MHRHLRTIPPRYSRGGSSKGGSSGVRYATVPRIERPTSGYVDSRPSPADRARRQNEEEDRLIAEAERVVADRRRAQQVEWARSVLATDGGSPDPAPTREGVRAELAQDRLLAWQVFARDGYRCQVCQAPGGIVELTVDHIVPVSAGGTNDQTNLQTLCRSCNSRKGARAV